MAARLVTYEEQVDLVRNTPRAAALGMRTFSAAVAVAVIRSQSAWNTAARLRSIIAKTTILRLTVVYATNHNVVPSRMTESLCNLVLDCFQNWGIDSVLEVDLGGGGE